MLPLGGVSQERERCQQPLKHRKLCAVEDPEWIYSNRNFQCMLLFENYTFIFPSRIPIGFIVYEDTSLAMMEIYLMKFMVRECTASSKPWDGYHTGLAIGSIAESWLSL